MTPQSHDRMPALLAFYGDKLKPKDHSPMLMLKARLGIKDELLLKAHAKVGGETGINGYHYKGGQFLPSTQAEPGKWKIGKKWVSSGKELIAPGQLAHQPTPFSRSLFTLAGVGYFSRMGDDGKLSIAAGVRDHSGEPITAETKITPGVKGVLGKESLTLGEIVGAWNAGQRWFDVKPEGVPIIKNAGDKRDDGFVESPDGTVDFGEITPEIAKHIGREAAKIRIRAGNDAEGLQHIEDVHGKDIRALGFADAKQFIHEITQHFTAIYPSDKKNSRGLVLVESRRKLKYANIQLEPVGDGSVYEIRNATPGRNDQFKNKVPLWERAGPSASSSEKTPLIPGAKAVDGSMGDNGEIIKSVTPRILFLKGGKPGAPGLHQMAITGKDGVPRVHWVKFPKSGKAAHNPNQGEFFDATGTPYQSLETRPDTTAKQKRAGVAALAALERRVNLLRDSGGSTASLLGVRLLADFQATGGAQLVGQKISSPADLAVMAQVYRDPRFETFRFIFVKDDEVVGESAYSSRLPGAVRLSDDFTRQLEADKKRYGANGYYMLHNHPGGRAGPSSNDRHLTEITNRAVSGLRGHVIIDHNEYGYIAKDGSVTVKEADYLVGVNFHATPSVDHPLLGAMLLDPKDVALAAKALQSELKSGGPVLIMTKGTNAEVELIASVPHGLLDRLHQHHGRAKGWLRGIGRASGAGSHRFLLVSEQNYNDRREDLKALISSGIVTDVLDEGGRSLRKQTPDLFLPDQGLFDPIAPGRKAAEPQRLADDLAAQERYLTNGALALGYDSIDDLAANDYPAFERLAMGWREENPVEDALYQPEAGYGVDRLRNTVVASVTGAEFGAGFDGEPTDIRALREAAKSWAIANIVGEHKNLGSGISLEVHKSGIKNAIQHGGAADKLRAFAAIPSVLRDGVVVFNGANPKNPRGRLVVVAAKVAINARKFYVSAGFREDANGRLFYDHELMRVERADGLSSQSGEAGVTGHHPAPSSAHLNDMTSAFLAQETITKSTPDGFGSLTRFNGGQYAA